MQLARRLAWHLAGAGAFGAAVVLVIWQSRRLGGEFWRPLAQATLSLVHGMLSLVYSDLVYEPSQFVIGTREFNVEIARQCSGYEGMGLLGAFLAGYLWLFRGRLRFPQALLLVPLGGAVIWLANAVRIAALVAIGASWSPKVAMGGFHSQAGWLALNVVGLGIVALTGRSRFFAADTSRMSARIGSNPTAACLGPFLAVLAAGMVARAAGADARWLEPVRVTTAIAALWCFRRAYPCYAISEGSRNWAWPVAFGTQPLVLGAVTAVLWVFLAPAAEATLFAAADASAALEAPGQAAWWGCRLLGYVVLTPVVEELAFRGYLTRRLQAADFTGVPLGRFTWFSCLASSLLFGALHGRAWLPGTLAGLLFATALYRRGRLADAIVAHGTANALLAAYAAATGNWDVMG